MTGNLEHGVSGGIENRLAGFHMLFTQLIQNHGTGRVAVTEVARQVGTFYQFIQQFLREAVFMIGEVTPVKQNRYTGDFPSGQTVCLSRKSSCARRKHQSLPHYRPCRQQFYQ